MKKLLSILLFFMLFALGCGYGCTVKSRKYSEEQHINRITKRIEKKFGEQAYRDGTYDSFMVYPLYNENDELFYFLVEFEPYGFVFVKYDTEFLIPLQTMYHCNASLYIGQTYWAYKQDEHGAVNYVLDENGESISYTARSPYYVSGNLQERKYILKGYAGAYVCAVKEQDEFINVISGDVIDVEAGDLEKHQVFIHIGFLPYGDFFI